MSNIKINDLHVVNRSKYLFESDEALTYIKSLPIYENYSGSMQSLPISGNYRLPVEACGRQWGALNKKFRSNFHFDTQEPIYERTAEFFSSLPGIAEVNFELMTVTTPIDPSFGARCKLIVTKDSVRREFDIRKDLIFEDSIRGAMTAFVMSTTLDKYISYWHALYGCDHTFIPYAHSFDEYLGFDFVPDHSKKFADALSEVDPIPWGFRLEMIEPKHYKVRALAQSPTAGLVDLWAEIADSSVLDVGGLILKSSTDLIVY